jgi:cysteinyl-tRNA synthetase
MSDPAFALQFQAKAVVAAHGPAVVRFLLLNGHYRRPVDFAPENIGAVATALGRLHRVVAAELERTSDPTLDEVLAIALPEAASRHRADFVAAMDDDFNTGAAIAELFGLAHLLAKLPAEQQPAVRTVLWGLGRLIGLFEPGDAAAVPSAADDDRLAQVMSLVLELRASARANRDFAASDRIRDRLKAAGIVVKDGKEGATWEFAP